MRIEHIGDATLYLGDCLEVLPTLPKVDAVITDPPYNVGKKYGTHNDSMERAEYIGWLSARWCALPTDTLVYTPGLRHFWDTPEVLRASGLEIGQLLGWHKKEYAGDKWTGGPAMCWEPVIWAHRGAKDFETIFGAWGRDFLVINATHGNPYATLHPCPKPIELYRWLIGLFAPETVLDPFMGTGTSGEVAARQGRSYIGIEIEPAFFDIACQRIENAQRQGRMFEEPMAKAEQHELAI